MIRDLLRAGGGGVPSRNRRRRHSPFIALPSLQTIPRRRVSRPISPRRPRLLTLPVLRRRSKRSLGVVASVDERGRRAGSLDWVVDLAERPRRKAVRASHSRHSSIPVATDWALSGRLLEIADGPP